MNYDETLREEVARYIWASWVDWARHEVGIDPQLLQPWDDLPPDRKDAGYRMAEGALTALRDRLK